MNTTDLLNKLKNNRKYRTAFAAAQFKRLVPLQIRALRKQREWSQEQLADNANVTQGVVSRAEDSDNGNLTVNTILRIADGFDAVFVGRFVPYSEFLRIYEKFSEPLPPIPSFEIEYGAGGEGKREHLGNFPDENPEGEDDAKLDFSFRKPSQVAQSEDRPDPYTAKRKDGAMSAVLVT